MSLLGAAYAVRNRFGAGPSFFLSRLDSVLDETNDRLSQLREARFSCHAPEIADVTGDLYESAQRSVHAVSLIAFDSYWLSRRYGPIALIQNQRAIGRGLEVERIFVVSSEADLVLYSEVLQKQRRINVRVFTALLADLADGDRRDFSLFDKDRCVQYFEFIPETANKEYSRCDITADPETVARYSKIYDRIRAAASEVAGDASDASVKSIWGKQAFREHYTGVPPDLHLDKLDPLPRRVLDIGCGAGRTLERFVDLQCEITGVDEDPIAVELCRKRLAERGASPVVVQGRFAPDMFRGRQFDVVVAYNVLYHGTRAQIMETLRGIRQVVTPGGYCLLTLKTLRGNEEALEGATEIEKQTFVGCNMPDTEALHHFCTDSEVDDWAAVLGTLVLKEPVNVIKNSGIIVQAAGYYLVVRVRGSGAGRKS